MKKVESQPAGGVFHREPLRLGVRADVNRLHDNRKANARGEIPAELLVACCGTAQPMIQVCERDQRKSVMLGKLLKQEDQCNRV